VPTDALQRAGAASHEPPNHADLPTDSPFILSLLPTKLRRTLLQLPLPSDDLVLLLRALLLLMLREGWAALASAEVRAADDAEDALGLAAALRAWAHAGSGHWTRGAHTHKDVPVYKCAPAEKLLRSQSRSHDGWHTSTGDLRAAADA
jgi:hypothetical protein